MFAFPVIMRSNTYVCPQNTVVVERWWQVPLSKVGSPPRLHPRRHRIYKLVEDTKHFPTPKMELILTQTVPSESLKQLEGEKMLGFLPVKCLILNNSLFYRQSLVDEETQFLSKNLLGETSCCPKALLCIRHQRIKKSLQKS